MQRVMESLMLTATNKEYHSRHGVAATTAKQARPSSAVTLTIYGPG